MPTTWKGFFLGYSAEPLDSAEGNQIAENATSFVGLTYGNATDPLADNIVEVQTNDLGGEAGVLDQDNNLSNDEITYDLGGGPVTTVFDGLAVYNATLTYEDGTTATITAVIFQDSAGNMFLAPEMTDNADTAALEAARIESLTLDSVAADTTTGLFADRYASTSYVCFARGTMIETPDGPVPVEVLRTGDKVLTRDNGPQPILWRGCRRVWNAGPGRACRIDAGALGPGIPRRAMTVSAQHRVFLSSRVAQRMFGHPDVLVPATKLAGYPGIRHMAEGGIVEYHHFLCRGHELVLAEGAFCETFLPRQMSLSLLSRDARREIDRICPNWDQISPARRIPSGPGVRTLLRRHIKNGIPLVSEKLRANT